MTSLTKRILNRTLLTKKKNFLSAHTFCWIITLNKLLKQRQIIWNMRLCLVYLSDHFLQSSKISKFVVKKKRSTQNFFNNNDSKPLEKLFIFSLQRTNTCLYKILCTWNRNMCFRWCGIEENILSRLNCHECPTTFMKIHPPAFLFLSCCLVPKMYPLIYIITYYGLKIYAIFHSGFHICSIFFSWRYSL